MSFLRSDAVWTPGAEDNALAPQRTANLYFGPQASDSLVEQMEESNPIIKILDILQTRYPLHQPTSSVQGGAGHRISISENIHPVYNRTPLTRLEAIHNATTTASPQSNPINSQDMPMRMIPMIHTLPHHQLPVTQSPSIASQRPITGKRKHSVSTLHVEANKGPTHPKKAKPIALADELRDQLREFYKERDTSDGAESAGGGDVTWTEDEDPSYEEASSKGKRKIIADSSNVVSNPRKTTRRKLVQANEAKRKIAVLGDLTNALRAIHDKARPAKRRVKVRDVVIDESPYNLV
jgi:hypothetical protein